MLISVQRVLGLLKLVRSHQSISLCSECFLPFPKSLKHHVFSTVTFGNKLYWIEQSNAVYTIQCIVYTVAVEKLSEFVGFNFSRLFFSSQSLQGHQS